MNKLFIFKRGGHLLIALFLLVTCANATSYVVENGGLLNDKVLDKVQTMGDELFQRTGISAFVSVPKSLDGKSIAEYELQKVSTFKPPYVLLTIAPTEKKVDIIHSKELEKAFDKDAILSPFPWTGTIIPILTGKKNNDNVNAAVINGYADIVEQIASSKNIELQSAIGSSNKNTINLVKVIVYGFLFILFAGIIWRKVKK